MQKDRKFIGTVYIGHGFTHHCNDLLMCTHMNNWKQQYIQGGRRSAMLALI